MPSADPEKRRAWSRAHYERNRQKYIDAAKRRQDTKRWRAKRKAAGLKSRGCVWERLRENVGRAAKRGKEYWPAGLLEAGWRRTGVWPERIPAKPTRADRPRKPWNDSALSEAERWRLRYRMDPEFQAREYLKALKRKRARRKMIAKSGLQQWKVSLLRIQSRCCAYCDAHMVDVTDRVIDHVVPISRGGPHEWDNLAVVCKPCNARKHNSMPTDRQIAKAQRQRRMYSGQLPLIAC